MNNYKQKYLKYKQKYLESKEGIMLTDLRGGAYSEENDEVIKYIKEKSLIIHDLFNSSKFLTKYTPESIFYGLDIFMKLDDIKTIFDKHNYLQLRPYQGETVLVIGCGNRRIDSANLLPDIDDLSLITEKRNYDVSHSHHNEFTIDLSLLANPSIISKFDSTSNFLTIPDHSFKLIYFEGSGTTNININEIKRLLNNKTSSFCIMMTDGVYHIHSYYIDGKFFNIE